GSDYVALPGSVTFPIGSASQTVTVTPIDNSVINGNRTAVLSLSDNNPVYNVGTRSATVNILDNELPTVSVTGAVNASEPSTAGQFTITRTGPTTAALQVNFTMSGTAVSASDYVALPS